MTKRVLTGITTSGTPHLGNYVGAIRPAIEASRDPNVESYYFLADYHALIKCQDPARVAQSTLEIAASWLACGLDSERVFFYRQSDVPEVTELTWLLTCVTAKGLLNRAHAYKAAVDANMQANEDPDAGVSAGLYMYPVLMAADILAYDTDYVPVGRDQVQHVEMAQDMAQSFNALFGEVFRRPEALMPAETLAKVPGVDGEKMSKSYGNDIWIFESGKALQAAIGRIKTDSRPPEEPKDPDGVLLFRFLELFLEPAELAGWRERARAGGAGAPGYGHMKKRLVEAVEEHFAPARARREALLADPSGVDRVLERGAKKARERAVAVAGRALEACGLR